MKQLVPRLRAGEAVVLSRRRKMVALAVAGASDLAQVVFAPAFAEGAGSPFDLALDGVTAVALLLILGLQWRLAIALAAELVPGVDLFPTWTAVVLSIPSVEPKQLAPSSFVEADPPPAAPAERATPKV